MSKKNITPNNGAESTLIDSNTNAVSVQDRIKMAANFLYNLGRVGKVRK